MHRTYIVSVIETPDCPDVARQLRSALRDYFAVEIMPNLYRVEMTNAQQVTLHQVADRLGGAVRYMDAPEPPRAYPAPRQAMSARARVRRMVPAL